MALAAYLSDTQLLLHDPTASYFSTASLTTYINDARNQIAQESQCVRVLVCGVISSVTVTAQGASYTSSATVAATGSGMGAVLVPQINAGAITSVTVIAGGTSWDGTTTIAATDTAGSGATFTSVQVGNNLTVVNQEIYTFASRNAAATAINSGINQIIGLMGISVSWGSMKPTLQRCTWGDFQANYRAWTTGYLGQPAVWAQYGQGASGSLYLCPMPSQIMNMDWDCWCTPIALIDDTTAEAIPYPWSGAVKYYAAYLAFANSQRLAEAEAMKALYLDKMKTARAASDSVFLPNPYG